MNVEPLYSRAHASCAAWCERALSMSIRYKIAACFIAMLCTSLASLGVVSFALQKRTLEDEMRRRALVMVRQLANASRTALLVNDELAATTAIRDLLRFPDVRYAVVIDRKGFVFAHSQRSLRGTRLGTDADRHALVATGPLFQAVGDPDDSQLDASEPILARSGSRFLRVGTARVGISLQPLARAVSRQKLAFLLLTLGFVVLGLAISFALARVLTRRIIVLMSSMKAVSQGGLNELVRIDPHDEIGALAESFNDMILHLREKLKMEKYLSSATLQLIHKQRDAGRLELGGERRHVAVLFSDIRGFTSLSETLDPADVVTLLNIYLTMQAEAVHARGGMVDKFIGDAVMAIFTDEDCEYRAALAAQEILNFTRSLNDVRRRARQRTMWLGIGLNAGSVIMANVGSERQMQYTVIGDPINTAARLCSVALGGQAVMSRAVADAVGERGRLRPLPAVTLKGKREPVEAWGLLDLPGAARRQMRRTLEVRGICRFKRHNVGHAIKVLDVGGGGCAIVCPVPLTAGSRLEISIPIAGLDLGYLRAVVRNTAEDRNGYRAGLEFEEGPCRRLDALTSWVHRVETQIAA